MRYHIWLLAICAGLAVGPAKGELLPGKSASELVEEGNEHFKKGDMEEALKRYLAAQSQHPNAPELHFNIGDVEFSKGKFDNAALEFRRVAQNSDRRLLPQAAYNLGTAMAQDKKTERAIELYKAAIKLDPNDVEARHNLGVLLEQQQKQQQQGGQSQDQKDQKDQQDPQQDKQDQKDQQKQDQKQGQSGQKPEDQKQGQQPPKPEQGEQQAQSAQGDKSDKPPEKKGEQIQGAIPREQAERLLDLLKDEEKQGMFLHQAPKSPEEADPEKDW
jgi:tetratricopeptide (TPR) repeat protein